MKHWWHRFWLWYHYWRAQRTYRYRYGSLSTWDYHVGRETHHLNALEKYLEK